MENVFFLHQIKKTNGVIEKGIVVKSDGTADENFEAAKQGFHAYMGAYAYNNDKDKDTGEVKTNYVQCMITDVTGNIVEPFHETWAKQELQPEPEAEEETEPEA